MAGDGGSRGDDEGEGEGQDRGGRGRAQAGGSAGGGGHESGASRHGPAAAPKAAVLADPYTWARAGSRGGGGAAEAWLRRLLFGGVYGTVLASSLVSALEHDNGQPDPAYDALWIAVAALTAAAAHGYAHAVAHWPGPGHKATLATVRAVLEEWPLVFAALPTVAVLLGAAAGWWGEDSGANVVLTVNTVALFGWGWWAARAAGQGWAAACRVGGVDALLGVFIVSVNALSH